MTHTHNVRVLYSLLITSVMFSCFGAGLHAQESAPSRRELELEETIKRLERRVDELERSQVLKENADGLEKSINEVANESALVDNGYTVFHKGNTLFESEGGRFKFAIHGRIQNDWTWATQDEDLENSPIGRLEDGTRFRRARLGVSGEYYKVNFKVEWDFAQGDADFLDAYMGIKFDDTFQVRVGQFREPFSLEELTSNRFLSFVERGLPSALVPSRNTGVMVFGTFAEQMFTYAAGAFRDTDAFGDNRDTPGTSGFEVEDGKYAATLRLTASPIYEDKGETLLHLGAGFSYRNPNNDTIRIRQRPEARIITNFIDTGNLDAEDQVLAGFEFALNLSSFWVQGEFIYSGINGDTSEDEDFYGWYAQMGYFLTGEYRPYRRDSGVFDRVRPNANLLDGEGGAGAWEVVVRISGLDATDGDATGGELIDFTFGVNWYLNPNTRVFFNYTYADLCDRFSNDDGSGHIFTIRFQIDF